MKKMAKYKRRGGKSKYILVLAAVFLCLFIAGNATATDGTTFPVDDAGISAYVKVSESIDLEATVNNLLPHIAYVIEVNPTYFIVTVTNDDNQITHLYVGADGWVIPYYLRTEHVSKVVRWNITSSQDPAPQNVSSMTTLEEVISKTCAAIGVGYETIKSDIKFYDFEHPDANRMMIVVDMQIGSGSNSFYMAIPPEVSVKESAYSHYYNTTCCFTYLRVNGGRISSHNGAGKGAFYSSHDLTPVQRNIILLINDNSGVKSGVGWGLVYQT